MMDEIFANIRTMSKKHILYKLFSPPHNFVNLRSSHYKQQKENKYRDFTFCGFTTNRESELVIDPEQNQFYSNTDFGKYRGKYFKIHNIHLENLFFFAFCHYSFNIPCSCKYHLSCCSKFFLQLVLIDHVSRK